MGFRFLRSLFFFFFFKKLNFGLLLSCVFLATLPIIPSVWAWISIFFIIRYCMILIIILCSLKRMHYFSLLLRLLIKHCLGPAAIWEGRRGINFFELFFYCIICSQSFGLLHPLLFFICLNFIIKQTKV